MAEPVRVVYRIIWQKTRIKNHNREGVKEVTNFDALKQMPLKEFANMVFEVVRSDCRNLKDFESFLIKEIKQELEKKMHCTSSETRNLFKTMEMDKKTSIINIINNASCKLYRNKLQDICYSAEIS